MANSYFKMFNNKVNAAYKEEFILGLHSDLIKSVKQEEYDLYSMLANLGSYDAKGLDISLLLKYYMLNQLMCSNIKTEQLHLSDTPNPQIKKDCDGKYYRLKSDSYVIEKEIQYVNDDGSYIVVNKRHNNSFKVIKTYNTDNQITSLKVTDASGNFLTNKNIVAELIGLRKEYKKKYKYSGYSGNSKDMVATIRNMFSTPVETGYYIDSHCFFYRWQASTGSFVRKISREAESPLLVDIEFRDNGTVLRQEYTGIVA